MCRRFAVVLFVALAVSISAGQLKNRRSNLDNLLLNPRLPRARSAAPLRWSSLKGWSQKKAQGRGQRRSQANWQHYPSRRQRSLPRGTAITGHVTEAKARSKQDSESELGISFDEIRVAGRQPDADHGSRRALAANSSRNCAALSSNCPRASSTTARLYLASMESGAAARDFFRAS